MKNLIKICFSVLLSMTLMVGIQSCSQYDDNTGISLTSKTERLSKAWKVENYKVDGVDLTTLMAAYTETFTKNGAYSYQSLLLNGTGFWDFQNGNAEIKISDSESVVIRTLTIQKLEDGAFWYYYMDGDSKIEFHLIPQ